MNTTTPFYRVHMTRLDGAAIDTNTGTLTFSHAYFKRGRNGAKGKPHSKKAIARKFNKSMGWKGYAVSAVETLTFDGNA